jgi:hypothetical protein
MTSHDPENYIHIYHLPELAGGHDTPMSRDLLHDAQHVHRSLVPILDKFVFPVLLSLLLVVLRQVLTIVRYIITHEGSLIN